MKIRFIARVFGSDREINPFTIDTNNLPSCIGNSVLQLEDFHVIEDAVLTSAIHSDGQGDVVEDIWTNEDESAEIEQQIINDARCPNNA